MWMHHEFSIELDIHASYKLSVTCTCFVGDDCILLHVHADEVYKDQPWYYLLANYPCYRLWPEMANHITRQLGDKVKDSAYRSWVYENYQYGSADKLGAKVETYRSAYAMPSAKDVFLKCLMYEVDFFNTVGTTY
jgi:thiaminase